MRILQMCADAGIAPGTTKGAAQHLRGTAAGLLALGHEVMTVTARPAEGPFPSPVYPLRHLGVFSHADVDVDIVYERYSLGHRGGLELARRLGRPFVLEVNAPLVDEALLHRPSSLSTEAVVESAVEAELLAEADLVIVVSRVLERWVSAQRFGPTVTIGNGFEPAWFGRPAFEHHDGAAATGPTRPLVFIGHPKPWHGADRLPRLLADVERRGHVVPLRIVGGGGGVEPIMTEAHRLGVVDRIEVTGSLAPPDAARRLAEGLIGLAPYPAIDPFYFCPLKIVDYLAAGLPVISTDQGDIGDLIGGGGLIVDPDNDEALADAVVELIENPAGRTAMASTGHRRAHTELTWTHVAAETVDAIMAVTNRLAVIR